MEDSLGASMYLPKVYDPAARAYRVRYAIANILRDRVVNEGAFNTCFEMDDAEEVICAILRRGLKNPKLRAALERSHLINLARWLTPRPQFSEAYYSPEVQPHTRKASSNRLRRKPTGVRYIPDARSPRGVALQMNEEHD